MSKPVVSIIIPTFNNPEFLNPCVHSILATGFLNTGSGELIIVNNGKQPCREEFRSVPRIKVIDAKENLGWEGGLQEGIKLSEASFVCFQNDDTYIPYVAQQSFYWRLLRPFSDDNVSAVAPVTTVAAGAQSIFHPASPMTSQYARWLIFFTVMIRRSHLEEVGGIDTDLPGGDDFDLSIRFRNAGKKLVINPEAFLIHHGFKTGTRVRGDHTRDGGWNSIQMQERTNHSLIKKHGFKTFFETISCQLEEQVQFYQAPKDYEGDIIRSQIKESDKVLEVACGFRKTVPQAIGVDRVPKGEIIPLFLGNLTPSEADVVADVTQPLPFEEASFDVVIARHILEHCTDPISTLKHWKKVLKPGGKLFIAVPDEKVTTGIPLSPDHCHVFDSDSLKVLLETVGFFQVHTESAQNGVSFVSVFENTPVIEATVHSGWMKETAE